MAKENGRVGVGAWTTMVAKRAQGVAGGAMETSDVKTKGVAFDRFHTKPGVDPYAMISWKRAKSSIKNTDGCIAWDDTVTTLRRLAEAVEQRRARAEKVA